MKKKEHHDIESVLEEHVEPGRRGSGAPERREKKAVKKLRSKSKKKSIKKSKPKTKLPVSKVSEKEEPEEFSTEEKKQEFIEEQLEEIGEAIEEEVKEKLEEAEEAGEEKEEPVAVFVKDKQTAKDISSLKKAVANGFSTTQKNIVVFYEQASQAGDRVRGVIYVLLGLSVMFTGFFAEEINLITFKDILVSLTTSFIGRIVAFTIGFFLFAYGTRKFFQGVWINIKKKLFPKKKPKFVQKKLV